MKILLISIISIFISGCISKSVVSSDPYFSEFVLRDIVLIKPVLVCEGEILSTKSAGDVRYKLLYNLNNISACPYGKTVGKLNVGTVIHINSIEKHKISSLKSATKVYFFGAATLSEVGKFNFYYLYGHEGYYENQPW